MRFIDLYEEYDNKLIPLEDMEDIEECEEVVRIENNGVSSEYYPPVGIRLTTYLKMKSISIH